MAPRREEANPDPAEPDEADGYLEEEAVDPSEALVVHVELPEVARVPDEVEAGVAIHDVAVSPLGEPGAGAATVTISLDPAEHAAIQVPTEAAIAASDETASAVSEESAGETAIAVERIPRRDRPAPDGRWRGFLYAATLHQVNLGDAPAIRERKALDARIGRPLDGPTRYVPVLTRKGGVGKTTITTLLGMALADGRADRVLAIDANPDRGTLSDRVPQQTRLTVRDIVLQAPTIRDAGEFASFVSRDATGLEVLASDTDPLRSSAFNEDEYNVVADIASRYCSIILTDCGTGIVHSVMAATLRRADQVVVVSGGSVDEARLASETLTWLEANGYAELARTAVVALNTATPNTKLSRLDELEGHFTSRVRGVVRIPYDPELAAGSIVRYEALRPFTRDSARELAALVVDGLVDAQRAQSASTEGEGP